MPAKKEKIKFNCTHCGKGFEVHLSQSKVGKMGKFCSKNCMEMHRRHGTTLVCLKCGKEFYRRFGEQVKNTEGKTFCSRDCHFSFKHEKMKRTTYVKVDARHYHRTVAEEILGRPLKKGEIVHHKNGDAHDNRKSNIMILNSQRDHAIIHFSKHKQVEAQEVTK